MKVLTLLNYPAVIQGDLKGIKSSLISIKESTGKGERRSEKRLTFNYAKVFIDKVTSYLMSGGHTSVEPMEDTDEARAKAEKAETVLYQATEDNNLEQLDFETELDCAILGDACYKVIWDQETKRVSITAPDIQGIYTWWMGDDTSKVWRVASKYSLTQDTVESLYGVATRGKAATIIEVWTVRDFELWIDGIQVEKKPNPYGFIPFVIYPNLREPKKFWGISDLDQLIEPQKELNRATSQLSKILELSGNPIAVLENVEESEDIAARPGAVWNIPEDAKAYLLDPLSSDDPVYSYGQAHPVFEGRYRSQAWEHNRVQVEGYDPVYDNPIVVDSFSWSQVNRLHDRILQIADINIDTAAKAEQRGEAYLREAEIESGSGVIRIPVNCGQQLYDVIDITDSRVGLDAEKKRVLGLTLAYNPRRGEYEQRLLLGQV
ncbi:phage portal protein [Chloroflexota bacterium]